MTETPAEQLLPWPAGLGAATVTARIMYADASDADADQQPDAIAPTGTVEFAYPHTAYTYAPTDGGPRVLITPRKIVCTINRDGSIQPPADGSQTVDGRLVLMPTTVDGLIPNNTYITATVKVDNTPRDIAKIRFAAAPGETINLADHVEHIAEPGLVVIVNEALTDRAETAATAATTQADRSTTEANRAQGIADTVQEISGLTGEDGAVALLLDQPGSATRDAAASVAIDATKDDAYLIGDRASGALRTFYDAAARRNQQTCRVVYLGSSTTVGYSATNLYGYVRYLTKRLQAAYPAITGVEAEQPVGNYVPIIMPGIQGWGMGSGGAQSSNYLTDSKVTIIGNLAPSMVLHLVGANDWMNFVPLETYKANLQTWLNKIRAANPRPCVHVYIHNHERVNNGLQGPYSAYRDALREFTLANPADTVFIDPTTFWARLGVPQPDPFGLMDPDLIHLNDRGHRVLADYLAAALEIPRTADQLPADTELALAKTRTVWTSDTFTGTGNAAGRATDVGLGGTPVTPTLQGGATGTVTVADGALTATATTRLNYPQPPRDHIISFTMGTPVAGAAWEFATRRTSEQSRVSIRMRSTGQARIEVREDGFAQVRAQDFALAAGDRVALKVLGSLVIAYVNDVPVAGCITTVTGPGTAFLEVTAGSVTIDDLKIEQIA